MWQETVSRATDFGSAKSVRTPSARNRVGVSRRSIQHRRRLAATSPASAITPIAPGDGTTVIGVFGSVS